MQQSIVVKLSRGRSVSPYVRASVGCPVHSGKMEDRIRMPFGIVGWTGPGMRQLVGSVHGKGYFWGRIWSTPLYPLLRRTCATVPQPSELRFGMVREVGRGIAVLDGGQRSPTGRGGFGGFCSPFSQ